MSMPALIDDLDALLVIGVDLVDGVVVGDQEALEAEFLLEDLGEQVFVGRSILTPFQLL